VAKDQFWRLKVHGGLPTADAINAQFEVFAKIDGPKR